MYSRQTDQKDDMFTSSSQLDYIILKGNLRKISDSHRLLVFATFQACIILFEFPKYYQRKLRRPRRQRGKAIHLSWPEIPSHAPEAGYFPRD